MYVIREINKRPFKNLNEKINLKGNEEQDNEYLFPGLYGNKELSRSTKGYWKQLINKHKLNLR